MQKVYCSFYLSWNQELGEVKYIIDNIADNLVTLKERKNKIDHDVTAFMKRGKNGMIFGFIAFGIFVTFFSRSLYESYGIVWLALLPVGFFIISIFVVLVSDPYRDRLRYRNRSSPLKLVGFNMDFNERVLRRIYGSLTRYEYLDENLTGFPNFYEVMVLDFNDHLSVLHFNCTQAQLKYILEKFKPLKKGLRLSTFERSGKIYNKGKPVSSESLSKSYNKNPLAKETEDLIDSFFVFLGDN